MNDLGAFSDIIHMLYRKLTNGSKMKILQKELTKWLLTLTYDQFVNISEKYLYVAKCDEVKDITLTIGIEFIHELYCPEQIVINSQNIETMKFVIDKGFDLMTYDLEDFLKFNTKKNELISAYINKKGKST